ncbi:tryptophan--tRNA ligase [Candidatus Dojkabacteria bacterium]|nr:tryptophan--tRNA ligase [Candidatus Dojkabacteria bacterium]
MKKDLSKLNLVTGITPSSPKGLHLGNYLGAVKPHVEFQDKVGQGNYFIADYHALNMVFDPEQFKVNVRGTYLDYLALGIDPERENVNFYIESGVPEIAELNIILNNVVTMAELKRMHAYKDKFQKGVSEDSINHGLFNYPVLMAADILIFGADFVPVGEDQKQHVEITRDIAQSFNKKYGEVLTVPDVYIKKEVARVVGIDGEKKMSKSLGNDIPIFGSEEEIRKQIFAIVTDPARIHPDDPGDPAKNPIFSYMKLMDYDESKRKEFEERYKAGTVGDVEIKKAFYEFFLEYFKEARERREKFVADEAGITELIEKNNSGVRAKAQEMMEKVRKAVGVD